MEDLDIHDLRHNRFDRQFMFVVIIVLSIATNLTVILPVHAAPEFLTQANEASLPPMTLTIVGANGTQIVLHETDIRILPTYIAYGGYKNQLGYIRGLGYYTGVRFTTLCNLVGGIQVDDTLRVTASDNYTKDFTYSEVVLGEFVTYDPRTGEQVPHNQPLVPAIAYFYNDQNITDGPLRAVIIGPEGLLTNSTYWVKWSIKMEILAGSGSGPSTRALAGAKSSFFELPPMSLTVVGANGTLVVLNETDIAGLSSYRGYGGFKNQLDIVKGLGNYTGVSLNTLCGLVGGLTDTSVVKVIASDDYSSIFTFDEVVNGNFTTYNSTNGEEVSHSQPLAPIVAYYFNDVNISESNGGPLRLAIVGPEGLVTNSTYWVKWVVRIEIIDGPIPEFPSSIVLSFLFITSIVAFSFKAFKRGHRNVQKSHRLTGECG
jgi:hypothetical protein